MLPWSTESLGKFCSSRWFILSISSSASSVTLFRWLSNSARAAASVAPTSLESSTKSATAWAYTNVTREVMSNKCALVKTYNICRTVFRTFLNGRRQIQKKGSCIRKSCRSSHRIGIVNHCHPKKFQTFFRVSGQTGLHNTKTMEISGSSG